MDQVEQFSPVLHAAVMVIMSSYVMSCHVICHVGYGLSFLNGVRVRQAVNIKTFVVKAIGIVSAVSASIFGGPEGPMIHLGRNRERCHRTFVSVIMSYHVESCQVMSYV